jgi:hypothetical protein
MSEIARNDSAPKFNQRGGRRSRDKGSRGERQPPVLREMRARDQYRKQKIYWRFGPEGGASCNVPSGFG